MNQKLEKFHKYMNLYQQLVKINAGRFVGEQLSEDVAQDTFIKMYEHLDYLDDDIVKPWLMVVSSNIAKDYLKKGGKYEIYPMPLSRLVFYMQDKSESAEKAFETEIQNKAALEFCRTACNLLYEKNPNWYYIMVDSCILDMTSKEIAEVLNLSIKNVEVMKARARAYLRKKLGDKYQELF